MARLLAVAFAWGLAGLVAVPLAIHLLVLALARAFDPHCGAAAGSPDAAACGSGAFGLALAAAMPAFALFFLIGLATHLRRRRAPADFASVLAAADEPPDEDRARESVGLLGNRSAGEGVEGDHLHPPTGRTPLK